MLAVASRATPRNDIAAAQAVIAHEATHQTGQPPQTDGPTSWSVTLGSKFPVDANAVSQEISHPRQTLDVLVRWLGLMLSATRVIAPTPLGPTGPTGDSRRGKIYRYNREVAARRSKTT